MIKLIKKFKKSFKLFIDMDKTLLFISAIFIIFGTLNIVTASSREAVVNNSSNMFLYFFKHCIILSLSFISFLFVINIPTKNYKNNISKLYFLFLILNFYLIINGNSTRGANNWIDLGFFSFQPSEFSKPVLIIFIAVIIEKLIKKLSNPNESHSTIIWEFIGSAALYVLLVYYQKDLGTAIIIMGIFLSLFIFSPIPRKEKFKSGIISVFVLGLLLTVRFCMSGYILSDTQISRLKNFINPCSNYSTTGYQVCNAYIAINNGGLTGVGLGKSTQKYSYIPEPHTDMVFAIIAEENGLVKSSLIFIAYIIILFRILKLSMKTKEIRNKYICLGTATYMFLHILINLGGLFGVLPLTGVPLPFLSYGGSFTLSFIITLGIIQRIHIEYKNERIKVE